MSYVVSRQRSYPDGILYSELETGGPDMTSPDMIMMVGEYDDPREAAQALIDTRGNEKSLVSIGTTGGGLFTHDPEEMTDADILAWGEKEYQSLPKCDRCGKLRSEKDSWKPVDDPDLGTFCSQYCCDEAISDTVEYVIQNEDEYTWYLADDTRDGTWVDNPDEATKYYRTDDYPDYPKDKGYLVTSEEAQETYKEIDRDD